MTELLTGAKQSSRITSRSRQGEELNLSARIFRPSRPVTASARVTCRPWRLVFECRTPPVIDPLMGYCGSGDTLSQVELNFPTREAAVAFAERQELDYVVHTDPPERPRRNVRTLSLNGDSSDRLRQKSRVMGAAITGR